MPPNPAPVSQSQITSITSHGSGAGARRNTKDFVYTSGEDGPGFMDHCLTCLSLFLICICCPCLIFAVCKNVREYERVVVFRNGRLQKGLKGPGVIHINPIIDKCITLDMRSLTHDIPKQEVLTQDSVTVQVDAIIYYKISDPVLAVTNVINYNYSTGLLSAALLRTVLGMHSLSEVLEQRQKISAVLLDLLDKATDPWGIKVDRVELKNVRLPTEMQRVMAAEAEASRDAKAKIVAAEGELHAAKALREAAIVLAHSPGGIQIRLLQTLEEVGATHNNTVVIPFPAEILRAYAK